MLRRACFTPLAGFDLTNADGSVSDMKRIY
jgi:hypothetical protein